MPLCFYTRYYDCVTSGFCPAVQENRTLQGNYAACSGNSLPPFLLQTYRSHIQGSRIQEHSWPLKMGPIGCPETSVRNCHYTLRNMPEECSSPILIGLGIKGANSEIKLPARISGFVFYWQTDSMKSQVVCQWQKLKYHVGYQCH
jgi:hypothetical protein